MTLPLFRDRAHAAARLVPRLLRFKEERPVILALPRGGIVIGFEVAKALEAPLDLVLVRKIGAPGRPELAIGAVVDGPSAETSINQDLVNRLEIPASYIAEECERELREIERRRQLYRGQQPIPDVAGHTAIVVDDGIATGATVRSALNAVRRARPRRTVLAVPVAPSDTVESLRPEVDEIVCLATPAYFYAIGPFYTDFRQVTDEEVVDLLARARQERGNGETPVRTAESPLSVRR